MKVGILTFHASINHGAFLQVFSSYKYLQEQGYDVSIVNYMSKKRYWSEKKQLLVRKNPISLFYNLNKIIVFKKSHKKLNLGNIVFDISKVRDRYDAFIIGSDVVWDFNNPISGEDLTYFGQSLEGKKLIAYAPSFGSINPESTFPEYIENGLNNFSYLSVRDENSLAIVKNLTGETPELVLDPTFLIDIKSPVDIDDLSKEYLLVYAYYVPLEVQKEVVEFARKKNLKIISIGYRNKWADKNILNVDPFEWVSYFKHAQYVVTSTFHGTVFSIKYNKEFFTILTDGNSNKTLSLLDGFDLRLRTSNIVSLEEAFKNKIDYSALNKILDKKVAKSKEYINTALNDY